MAACCHLIHSGAGSLGLMWLGKAFLLRVPFPMSVRNGLTASDPCQSAMDLKPNGSGYIFCFTWWLAVVVFAVVVVVVVVIVVVFVAVVVNAAVVVCCHCCCCCCCVCRLLLYAVVAFFLASHCTSASMLPHACAIFLTSASMLPVDHISMKGYSLAFWDDLYIPVS